MILTLETCEEVKRKMRPLPGQPFSQRWFEFCLRVTRVNDPYVAVQRVKITPLSWATYICCWAGYDLPPQVLDKPRAVIPAYIYRSQWTADCPQCGSPGKDLVSKTDPLFWCINCHLQHHKPELMTTVFPKDTDRIEYVLLRRKDPTTRNWLVTETVDDLVRENYLNGVM